VLLQHRHDRGSRRHARADGHPRVEPGGRWHL
jgi:hypothetical protein